MHPSAFVLSRVLLLGSGKLLSIKKKCHCRFVVMCDVFGKFCALLGKFCAQKRSLYITVNFADEDKVREKKQ